MMYLKNTLWIESRKATRAKLPWFTVLGFMIVPLMCTFLIFINNNQELSRKLGLVSAKASMFGQAGDWPAYLNLVTQAVAIGGFFLFCLILSWVFGREFADGTLKDMLAVPVPRVSILMAKFIVVMVWCTLLSLEVYLVSLLMGVLMHLPMFSPQVLIQGGVRLMVAAALTVISVLPFALVASAGRGYLLPLGMAVLTMVISNVIAVAGWGEIFPWTVSGMYTQCIPLPMTSYVIVIATGLLGMIATYAWWMMADQSQ